MRKLKMLAAAGLATGALAVGGLAAAPSASAAPTSCSTALAVAHLYHVFAGLYLDWGNNVESAYWTGRADELMSASCE